MQKRMRRSGEDITLRPPAYPLAGPELFNRLRTALSEAFGKEQHFPRLARLTNQPRSTTQHWFQTFDHPHVKFFLCLLEQLPERKRAELLAEFCRELPLLTHPRLGHDPMAVGALENILHEEKGLTVIRGGSEFQRTFVATALCHSSGRSFRGNSLFAGLDVHEPKKLVPVEGITYCREPISPSNLQLIIKSAWPEIIASEARIIMLNGIWTATENLRSSLAELASTRHLIIADPALPEPADMLRRPKGKTNVVTVNSVKENPAWIRVSVAVL